MYSLFSVFTLFYLILKNMSTNVRKFLVIFDTCDVAYNWFISLLPPNVLDNLFATVKIKTYCYIYCKYTYIYLYIYLFLYIKKYIFRYVKEAK